MKYFLILNLSRCAEPKRFAPEGVECSVPPIAAPTVVYGDRPAAERELLRLKLVSPKNNFFFFESVASAAVCELPLGMPVALLVEVGE